MLRETLNKIRIVLVETSHPGNIGSAARAMKIMGLSKLFLVNPKKFPDQKANELASRADDILESAIVVTTLKEAVADCSLVIGMSARERIMPQPMLNPKEAAELVLSEYGSHDSIALVFGRESSGLNNEELEQCLYQVKIPTMPDYSSLNLAAAVQVIAYEIFSAFQSIKPDESVDSAVYPTHEELEGMYDHIEEAMVATQFLKPENPRRLMQRVRQIFHRARLDREDLNLIRGFMAKIIRNSPFD